jgi:hypothetical protein
MLVVTRRVVPQWQNFMTALKTVLTPFRIDARISFFPELILLLGGLDKGLVIEQTSFGPDMYEQSLILKVMITDAELESWMQTFSTQYPQIRLRVLTQAVEEPKELIFSFTNLVTDLIPLIPTFSTRYTPLFEKHQKSIYQVTYNFGGILSKYNICSKSTDVVEETICRLVQRAMLLKLLVFRQYIMHFVSK